MSREFRASVGRWVKASKATGDLLHRNLLVTALKTMRQLTPVDTGRARDSWRVSKNRPIQTADRRKGFGRFEGVVGKVVSFAQFVKARRSRIGGVYFISNNVPYAKKLEEGHSRQNELMLRKTFYKIIAEFPAMVEEAKRGVRR